MLNLGKAKISRACVHGSTVIVPHFLINIVVLVWPLGGAAVL